MKQWAITVPKTVNWNEYLKEIRMVERGRGVLNYRVPNIPKELQPGDRCYIVYDGQVRGWHNIIWAGKRKAFRCQVTGTVWPEGEYIQRAGKFHEIKGVIPARGFQGIRRFERMLQGIVEKYKGFTITASIEETATEWGIAYQTIRDADGWELAAGFTQATDSLETVVEGQKELIEDCLSNPEVYEEAKCRVCGCTDDQACVGGCYWVEPDLCSQCANTGDQENDGE